MAGKTQKRETYATSDRRLIALQGGPKDGYWFWWDEWRLTVVSNVRQFHQHPDHPALRVLHYKPTGERVPHRTADYGSGEVWRYAPHAEWPPVELRDLVGADLVSRVHQVPAGRPVDQ